MGVFSDRCGVIIIIAIISEKIIMYNMQQMLFVIGMRL